MRRLVSYLLGSAALVLLLGMLPQGASLANATSPPTTTITLVSNLTVTAPGGAILAPNGAYGVIAGAQWIAGATDTGAGDTFSVTFTLPPGYANAQLSGEFFADNWATVWLNGVQIAGQTVGDFQTNFGINGAPATLIPLTTTGFLPGLNTLTFKVSNAQINDLTGLTATPDGANPEALDFSATVTYGDKGLCKKGGWQTLDDGLGHTFKNQGDCVSFVATGGTNVGAGPAPAP